MTPDTALTTIEPLKTYLGIDVETNVERDDSLEDLIKRYSAVVSSWCERRFTQTTNTEYYSGNGSPYLWLDAFPITTPFTASHGIWEDSARKFGSGTQLVEDVPSNATSGDFYVVAGEKSQGRVTRLNGVWPRGEGNIKAVYQSGYAATAIPGPVVEAVHRLIGRAFQISENKAHATTSQGNPASGGSVSFVEHKLPADVITMLQPWKRMRVA